MTNPIKMRVLATLKDSDPIASLFSLLTELGSHKDAEVAKDVVMRILETQHDWESIRQCLQFWPTMLPWANEFLRRMYKRIEDAEAHQPVTTLQQLDQEIERVSNIYWSKNNDRKEPKCLTNKALRGYLEAMKEGKAVEAASIAKLPQFFQSINQRPQSKFTVPKNPDFTIDQEMRKNAYAESGYKEIQGPSTVPTYAWKLPDLPKFEDQSTKQSQSVPAEPKPLFDGKKTSVSKFNAFKQTFKEEMTPSKQPPQQELSFAFSPLNGVATQRGAYTRSKFHANLKIEDEDSGEDFDSLARPTAPRVVSYVTDVNQLHPTQAMIALSRNPHYCRLRNGTTTLENLTRSNCPSILGECIKDLEAISLKMV